MSLLKGGLCLQLNSPVPHDCQHIPLAELPFLVKGLYGGMHVTGRAAQYACIVVIARRDVSCTAIIV